MVTQASLFGLEALEGNMTIPGEKPPPQLHPTPPFTWWMVGKRQAFSSLGGTPTNQNVFVSRTESTQVEQRAMDKVMDLSWPRPSGRRGALLHIGSSLG